jgi:hypothetical protein
MGSKVLFGMDHIESRPAVQVPLISFFALTLSLSSFDYFCFGVVLC